ncbi:MAG: PQQ-like beta-propeller repeat protein, partial [Planctomycetales bacterium]|nr:PQQ-like beta-propeller repeat protein [Planctomycetales bacterium]
MILIILADLAVAIDHVLECVPIRRPKRLLLAPRKLTLLVAAISSWLGTAPIVKSQVAPTASPASSAPAELPPDLRTYRDGEDWPIFLGPRQDGTSREQGLYLAWDQAPPTIRWQVELGTGYGICSVSRGRCFQFDRTGEEARLRAFNSETGTELWSYTYPSDYEDAYRYDNGPRTSPVVDGDRVYVFGAEGELHCVNVEDGRRRWHIDTAEHFGVVQNFFGVGSTPVVDGDLLIVMVGGSPDGQRGRFGPDQLDRVKGNGSGIVAFDKINGKVRYSITDQLASYASLRVATWQNRRWCFAFARGGLVVFHPQQGRVDFEFPWRASSLESVNASVPIVVDNQVLISETYGPGTCLLQFDQQPPQVIWQDGQARRSKSLQTHWNTGVYHDGFVYASSGRHEGNAELRCVEWKTGKVRWSQPEMRRCSLLLVEDRLICLSEDGTLYLLRANPEAYEQIARFAPTRTDAVVPSELRLLRRPAWAAPIIAEGLLYVRGADRLV